VSEFLQALGLVAFTVAAWLSSPIFGLVALGFALVVVGYALEGVTVASVARAASSRVSRLRLRRGSRRAS
jgi:hypothetical protein